MEWKTLQLGDPIFKINTRTTTLRELPKKFSYIDIDAVKTGKITNPKLVTKDKAPSRARRIVKEGDVLIASVRPYLRSFALVTGENSDCIASTGFFVIEKSPDIEPRYILYYALSDDFIRQTNELTQGASYPALNRELLNLIFIPIPFKNGKPDIAEQKRIADELDIAASLHEKIKSEIRIAENLFISICGREFSEIKLNFKYEKLGNVCNIIKGKFPTLKTPEGKYTFVVTSEKRKSANGYQFDGEAVCVPLVSSTGHGHASLHRIHFERGRFALANIMVAIVPKDSSKILAKYLYYYLSFYRNDLFVPLMRGVANVTIPLNEFNGVNVAIPDIQEQQKIVSMLDEVEKLKKKFSHNAGLSERFLQSATYYSFQMQT